MTLFIFYVLCDYYDIYISSFDLKGHVINDYKKSLFKAFCREANDLLQFSGSVATLVLGSKPKQGFARVRAKREVRESHLMLPRVQKSVRE